MKLFVGNGFLWYALSLYDSLGNDFLGYALLCN